jgi:hypothetical protein
MAETHGEGKPGRNIDERLAAITMNLELFGHRLEDSRREWEQRHAEAQADWKRDRAEWQARMVRLETLAERLEDLTDRNAQAIASNQHQIKAAFELLEHLPKASLNHENRIDTLERKAV